MFGDHQTDISHDERNKETTGKMKNILKIEKLAFFMNEFLKVMKDTLF